MKFLNLFTQSFTNTIIAATLIGVTSNISFAQVEQSVISLEALRSTSDITGINPFELGDFIDITFDNFVSDSILLQNTSGKFQDWLGEPNSELFSIPSTTISLINKRPIINSIEDETALYQVTQEAIFDFSEQVINNTDNVIELMWVIPVNTSFIVNIDFTAIVYNLCDNCQEKPFWKTGIDSDRDGIIDEEVIWNVSNDFYFYQIGSEPYGNYSIQSTVVPEPLTILGSGAAIAFGVKFKRKLNKAKKK